MYSFPDLEPIYCSMSGSNCCFLTCIQISQEAGSGSLVFPSLQEFPTVCCNSHSQRLWRINKAEVDVFLELSCFFDKPADVGNLIILDIDVKVCQNLPCFPTLNPHFIVCLWIIFKLSRKCLLSGQPQK